MKSLLQMAQEDGELRGIMYRDYVNYMLRKGVTEDHLMSYAQWEKHLGIVPVHMKYIAEQK